MAGVRAEPFHVALASLRERLREGAFLPGARITAVDVADELRLSATPVREALSRLAGEGLIEDRRGQGFFVRPLSAADVADLYRLSLAHLLIAQEPHRKAPRASPPSPPPMEDAPATDPVRSVERLFARWTAEAGSRALLSTFRIVQIQLGAVRRLEPLVFDDLDTEADRLAALGELAPRPERLSALRQFHGRRIRMAEALAALLARPDEPRKIVPV